MRRDAARGAELQARALHGEKVAAHIAQTTGLSTCGELARAEPQAVDQWKVPRFTCLR